MDFNESPVSEGNGSFDFGTEPVEFNNQPMDFDESFVSEKNGSFDLGAESVQVEAVEQAPVSMEKSNAPVGWLKEKRR